METILRMVFPTLQYATSLRIAAMGLATLLAMVFFIALARRWQSYWWLSLVLLATSFAGIAVASWAGLRILTQNFADVSKLGGGIGAISFGIWQATQVPLAAAWIGVITSVVAAVFLAFRARQKVSGEAPPFRFAVLTGMAVAAGLAPVLLFRRSIAFLLAEITPGSGTAPGNVAGDVISYLTTTTVVSAVCFGLAIAMILAMVRLARRSGAPALSSLITAVVLVLSLGVSTCLVTILAESSVRFRDVALNGRTDNRQPTTAHFAMR